MSGAGQRLDEALDARLGNDAVQVAGDGWQAEVHADQVGPVGVVVDRLRVSGAPGDLGERAEELVRRLRPGGERLRTVELAPELGGAVLRSEPEDMRDGRFYEVELGPSEVELSRHRVRPEGGRVREPFAVTREELGRIVDVMGESVAAVEPGED